MNRFFFGYLFFLLTSFLTSQNKFNFIWPLDSPVTITGNYGELRPNHFHAGLDFSTNGQLNLQVYSVAEGFVSRIKVSSVGYGKSVYITHPNGRVSVYAHLNSFSLKIDQLVKKEQFLKQSYEIEIFPKPNTVFVRKNEIIGLSGNTGGSTGPHLHFEIRDEKTETPLNPLRYFKIDDQISPVIKEIGFYDLSDTCNPKFIKTYKVKEYRADSLILENDHIHLNESILGFAFSGFDAFRANGNPNNVYAVTIYLNDALIYSHRLDGIDFSNHRYVNEFSEVIHSHKFQKCFLPTNYPDHFYFDVVNKGRLVLSDSAFFKIKVVVVDERGNRRALQFYIKAQKRSQYNNTSIKSDVFVNCLKDFKLKKNSLDLFIPAKTLYYSASLIIENTLATSGKLIVLPSDINLRSPAIIGFQIPNKYARNKQKLILKSGSSVVTPTFRSDSVFYSIKQFGWLQLDWDTVAPKLKPTLSLRQSKKVSTLSSISFLISDNLSGIAKSSLFLNDKWVLGEYDAKTNLVIYTIDETTPFGNLKFKLVVEDRVGNTSFLECSYYRN